MTGGSRGVSPLVKIPGGLRPAMMADADFLLRLRNDPETQRWSATPGTVTETAHRDWLHRTLSAVATSNGGSDVFLVGEVGAVRAILRRVSLAIAPEHRGQGYAVPMLHELARWCVGRVPYLDAQIARANYRSLRAFARAGYTTEFAAHGAANYWLVVRRELCNWCYRRQPHHRIAERSIGGPRTRTIYDLHEVDDTGGVGLAECTCAHFFDERLLP